MEQTRATAYKLLALTVIVLSCAGAGHWLTDRQQRQTYLPERSYEYLLPSQIGGFHVISRWKDLLQKHAIKQYARYEDATRNQSAQIDILINNPEHDGVLCYVARGVSVNERRNEMVQGGDLSAAFDVAFIGDQSLTDGRRPTLLVASTECNSKGCVNPGFNTNNEPKLFWPHSPTSSTVSEAQFVPVTITFQSLPDHGSVVGRDAILLQFREFVSNFRFLPLCTLRNSNVKENAQASSSVRAVK